VNPFETETMADLCLRQGHSDEALAIYRRLLARTADEAARERMVRRIAAVERDVAGAEVPRAADARDRADRKVADDDAPLPIPGIRARRSGDSLTIEWRLPPRTKAPGLEILLVMNGPAGMVTETRAIDVDGDAGQITLTVPALHLARAAVGFRSGANFVPVARN
jgi:hypothetical protein